MKGLAGQVILVTGARGNVGAAVAEELASCGASLVCGDASALPGTDGDNRLQMGGLDLSDPKDAARLVAAGLERFGHIDALINTIGGFRAARVTDAALADWDFLFGVNARVALVVSAAVIPAMAARGYGRIVHISAGSAMRGSAGTAVYSAAKAAVLRVTEAIADEHGDHGIVCNCILPSTIDTPQNRAAMPDASHEAWVTPSSIAKLAAFLASDNAGAITGAAIPVTRRYGG